MELTLALLLFADASTVRLREVEGDAQLPMRLLLLGLPLTIALGILIGALLFPAAGWPGAALIASILVRRVRHLMTPYLDIQPAPRLNEGGD